MELAGLEPLMAMGEVGATGPQLLADLGIDKRTTLYKALRALTEDGSIVKDGPRGRERYRLGSGP